MFDFSFETQGTNSYLVCKVPAGTEFDSMSLGMLNNNTIPGLAPFLFGQMDNVLSLKYNISSKIAVSDILNRPVSKKHLTGLLKGICDAVNSAGDYMIDSGLLVLDTRFIFMDVSSSLTTMICLPLTQAKQDNTDLKSFLKNIIYSVQLRPTENGDYFAKIVNYLNQSNFTCEEFCKILSDLAYDGPSLGNTLSQQKQAVPAPMPLPPTHKPQPAMPSQGSAPVSSNVSKQQSFVPSPENKPAAQPSDNSAEDKMSLMYLLRHYSAENAAVYKAQQGNDKSREKEKKSDKERKTVKKKDTPSASFAIPGQESPSPIQRPAFAGQNDFAVSMRENRTVDSPVPNTSSPLPFVPDTESNFGETVMIGGGAVGETIAIFGNNESAIKTNPHLIRARNNEKIPINAASFRIGKEPTFADYCISDNPSVSRAHAVIETRGEHYYVKDLGSTNHTFLNGEDIMFNTDRELTHGDTISFGSEDFEFRYF